MAESGASNKWSTRFPAYQIDFQIVSTGKMVAGSKRRIRWRFGFPSREALDAGLSGTDCRGEEHDITIVWSVASGKRMVLADGHQVHVSTKRSDVMEYSWTLRGHHVCKVTAYAAPPMSATVAYRQYDLFVDGMSYFRMPKVYELGVKGDHSAVARQPGITAGDTRTYDLKTGQYTDAPRTAQEEEAALQAAIQASLEESKQFVEGKTPVRPAITDGDDHSRTIMTSASTPVEADLLDFMSETAGAHSAIEYESIVKTSSFDPNSHHYDMFSGTDSFAVQPYQHSNDAPQQAYNNYSVDSVSPPNYAAPGPFGAHSGYPSQATPLGGYAPSPQRTPQVPSAHNAFQPIPPGDPFAPAPVPAYKPTYKDVSNSILGAYSASENTTGASHYEVHQQEANEPGGEDESDFFYGDNKPAPVTAKSTPKKKPDDLLSKLVNFDDLNSAPVQQMSKLTLSMSSDSGISNKSKGKPSLGANPNQTLGDLAAKKKPATSVMNAPVPAPGAMVMHAAHQNGNYGYNSGPPPIQKQHGFGVGATMSYGPGVANTQPPAYGGGYQQPPQPMHSTPPIMHQQQFQPMPQQSQQPGMQQYPYQGQAPAPFVSPQHQSQQPMMHQQYAPQGQIPFGSPQQPFQQNQQYPF